MFGQRNYKTTPKLGARINWAHPLARGLVSCYLINEGAGSKVKDVTYRENDGTLTGMNPESDWLGSPLGGSLHFDGSDDFVSIPDTVANSFALRTTGFTLSAWFAPTGEPPANWGRIVSKSNGSTSDDFALSYAGGTSGDIVKYNPAFRVTTGTGVGTIGGTTLAQPNTGWYHVAGTWDLATMRIYVNGVLEDSEARGGVLQDSDERLAIGGHADSALRRQAGYVDDVRLYQRALNDIEIQQLYSRPNDIFLSNNNNYFASVLVTEVLKDIISPGIIPFPRS